MSDIPEVVWLTQEAHSKLEDELTNLKTVGRPEVSNRIQAAREEGDLSENGEIDLTVTGGVGPFDIAWTGPNGFTSTNEDISGLASGDYSVTVTSAMGCTTTAQATATATPTVPIATTTTRPTSARGSCSAWWP